MPGQPYDTIVKGLLLTGNKANEAMLLVTRSGMLNAMLAYIVVINWNIFNTQ